MIDFDGLVLGPCMAVLSIGVTITPEVSRPGDPPYDKVGIFSSQPLTVEMQDGSVFSDQQTTLGFRVADFKYLPVRGDRVKLKEGPQAGHKFWVGDISFDGQGGAFVTLRATEPS